jgi:hypothetical protein
MPSNVSKDKRVLKTTQRDEWSLRWLTISIPHKDDLSCECRSKSTGAAKNKADICRIWVTLQTVMFKADIIKMNTPVEALKQIMRNFVARRNKLQEKLSSLVLADCRAWSCTCGR